VGVFEVYAGEEGDISPDEKSILDEVADDVSVALENIAMEAERKQRGEELARRVEELERFQKATVQREFRIKELRDEIESLKAEIASASALPAGRAPRSDREFSQQ
jgi:GAF domain-containing protein